MLEKQNCAGREAAMARQLGGCEGEKEWSGGEVVKNEGLGEEIVWSFCHFP